VRRGVVDTHAHLGLCEPADGELVAAARGAGVRRILTVGIDEASSRDAIEAARAHEEVRACVGRHPNSARGFNGSDAAVIEDLASDPQVAAVGETGLDYYRDRAPRADQRRAFEAQIGIARRRGKPLVVHMRESAEDTFEILGSMADRLTVILHCFSAPERVADAAERGWYCSFAGNLTYPAADELREAARAVPDDLLLVETDSPFLAPKPHRGEPNQPANVVATAEHLAELRSITYPELERALEANAARAFEW
jgi:TatD DNase family protein